nr:hypothetical protein BaRGS_032062 [Batillaria attramentaria]
MFQIKMLPTPAKFHYIFNLRDLSRIWQGMVTTISSVVAAENIVIALWKHECCRVIADRDAAEPTGEEGEEEADFEVPRVYEPIPSYEDLEERLRMFMGMYNEQARGGKMDLVFFKDAMVHLVKISRIISTPRGHALLVGVGGSGKQSLTRLSSAIYGYGTFQITLTRSYNVNNLLDDLKFLYRTAGGDGHGITFIFTDNEVKDEGFLEYLNNMLSSGVVANLFPRDEMDEILGNLAPPMKKEFPKRPPTMENLKEYYLYRTRKKSSCSSLLLSRLEKLIEASQAVAELSEELVVKEKDLAVASEKAEAVLKIVSSKAAAAEKVKAQVQKVKDAAQEIVDAINADKVIAEAKLEAARPALEEAEAALNTIKPADIATVRKLGKPPHLIMRIMDCVLILFQAGIGKTMIDPDRPEFLKPSWANSLK